MLDNKSNGGEGGIRTPDRGVSPYNGLANRRLQPLGHLSGDLHQFNTPVARGLLLRTRLRRHQSRDAVVNRELTVVLS